MGILKYKYKAHKLVNTLFYVIVFGVGFLLGFGAEKIDYSKIISQVLMIDSAKAYTLGTFNGDTVDEQYIYDMFSTDSSFDIKEYKYIACSFHNTGLIYFSCIAMNEETYNNVNFLWVNTGTYYFRTYNGKTYDYYSFKYDSTSSSFTSEHYNVTSTNDRTSLSGFSYSAPTTLYTNFTQDSFPDYVKNRHLLDFSSMGNLEYNENLFKDNPDFKEVCVNNYDTFSITTNEIQTYGDDGTPMYHGFDFMWFPNGMKGISTWGYDSEEHDHVYLFEKSENTFSGWWYWLNTREEIDLYFGRDNPGMYLELKGYKNKYDYYNYTFYPFEMTLTESYHRYQVFWFKDPYIEYLDGTIKNDSEKYCFYIKNEFDVNILTKNANGDFNSSITILGGINKDDVTYENELNNNSNGFFSTVNNFISKIRPTVMFINTHILELYTSMPLIVRSFILSFLVLIIIRILIGMVVR